MSNLGTALARQLQNIAGCTNIILLSHKCYYSNLHLVCKIRWFSMYFPPSSLVSRILYHLRSNPRHPARTGPSVDVRTRSPVISIDYHFSTNWANRTILSMDLLSFICWQDCICSRRWHITMSHNPVSNMRGK